MVNSTKRKGQKRKANSPSSKPVKSLRRDFSSKFGKLFLVYRILQRSKVNKFIFTAKIAKNR